MERIFLEDWVVRYGIPDRLLMDKGPKFVENFFNAVCVALETKLITTTAYHRQTNGQTEHYNKTILSRLCHYISEHQDDWDTFVYPLTYA